jgi:hypothetical protein
LIFLLLLLNASQQLNRVLQYVMQTRRIEKELEDELPDLFAEDVDADPLTSAPEDSPAADREDVRIPRKISCFGVHVVQSGAGRAARHISAADAREGVFSALAHHPLVAAVSAEARRGGQDRPVGGPVAGLPTPRSRGLPLPHAA